MCGRFAQSFSGKNENFGYRFELAAPLPDLRDTFNVAPAMTVPVVTRNSPNKAELMRWGISVPWMSKPLINIRDDSILKKPWTKRYTTQRCIVPIDGFYEWQRTKDEKIPYFIGLDNQEWIGLAGVYVTEKDDQGHERQCFAIVTTEPNELMRTIHNRMPVILFREEEETWLEPGIKDMDFYANTLSPYPDDRMFAYPVSKRVNNPKNNDEALRRPWSGLKPAASGIKSPRQMVEEILD